MLIFLLLLVCWTTQSINNTGICFVGNLSYADMAGLILYYVSYYDA